MTLAQLFSDANAWTQGAYARDQEGNEVEPTDPAAVSWDIRGGLKHVYRDYAEYCKKHKRMRSRLHPHVTPAEWIDAPERTHLEVLAFVKECGI